jgi:beta-lactamase regulating signal transducer with metallopeptidase domain
MLWWLAHNTVTASVLALAVLLLCRFWSFRPSIRHALWLVVLLKLIAPPFVAWPWNPLEAMGLAQAEKQSKAPLELSQLKVVNLVNFDITDSPLVTYQLAVPGTPLGDESAEDSMAIAETSPVLGYLQPVLLGLWAVGAVGMFIVQIIRASRFRRLMRGWRPAPRRLRRQVDRLAKQMSLKKPRLLLLPGLHSPFIWSLLRPWLLWPGALDERLSHDSHKTVIVHELAHLRRRDHWVGWLQLAGECIFWWNPLFWFVRRQIRFHAELSCDAWVMRLLPGARRAYAEALIEVTALISRAPAPVPALGMSSAARQDFERRLTMIMSERVPGKAPLVGLAAIGLLALAVFPAFSQNVKSAGDQFKSDLVSTIDLLVKQDNEARIDLLISELDGLISTINEAHDDNAPGKQENVELKLSEAIELAYSEALLLKDGDDNQSEKSREEKIKQIEKNLQQLIKEVQSLKSGAPGKGPMKIEFTPKVISDQTIILDAARKAGAGNGTVILDHKPVQEYRIIQQKDGKSGDVIYELVSPKAGQKVRVIADEKLSGTVREGEGKKTISLTVDPSKGDTKTFTIVGDVKEGQPHAVVGRVLDATKEGHGGPVSITVTQSKDGKSMTVNGKVVQLPKAGESKTITIEASPEGGKGKPVILNLKSDGAGQPIKIEDRTFQLTPGVKGDVRIFKFDEGQNKEGAGKGEHGRQFKQIIIDDANQGKVIHGKGAEGDGKLEGTIELKGKVIELKDGKPLSIRIEAGDVKLQPKIVTDVKVAPKGAVATKVTPAVTAQTKTATWTIQSDKGEQGKTATWIIDSAKPESKDTAVKVWSTNLAGTKRSDTTKATYKLPTGKAAAVASFLKENVKGAGLQTKVEGDALIVTGSPEAQKAVASLIELMQGKATGTGTKIETKYELKVQPDGKNDSSKNFNQYRDFEYVTPHVWAGATQWEFARPEHYKFDDKNASWFTQRPAVFGTFFAPAKVEKKAEKKGDDKKENN